MIHLEIIRVEKPYRILEHLHTFAPGKRPVPCAIEGNTFRRLLPIEGEYIPAKAIIHEEEGHIELTWYGDDKLREKVCKLIKHILSVDVKYEKFLQALKNYPELMRIALKHMGLRPARNMDLYEALIKAVIQQRIALRVALNITAKIVERYGVFQDVNSLRYYSFPPAEVLSSISPDEIRALGLTKIKAKSIVEIAKMAVQRELPSLKDLRKRPEDWVDTLLSIYGVGRWTAELAIATVIHDFSIGPAGDLNVMKGFRALGVEGEKEIRLFLSNFGEWRGLLMYLLAIETESK